MKLLDFRDLKARGIVDNRMTLKRWIDQRGFPPGFLLGPNTRRWTEEEIDEYVENQRRGVRSSQMEAA